MSLRITTARSLHDLGAAAWFGGSLMGALGVNGAAAAVRDPKDRARVSAVGWAKWTPANAAAIAAHVVGGAIVFYDNRGAGLRTSPVSAANTVAKLAVTGAALGATAYSGVLGSTAAQGDGAPVHGATDPASSTPPEVADAQQKLRYLQWALPVLTGTIVVLGAQQGEQQRPTQIASGLASTLARRVAS